MRKTQRKLTLVSHTIRMLDKAELGDVHGAGIVTAQCPTYPCPTLFPSCKY